MSVPPAMAAIYNLGALALGIKGAASTAAGLNTHLLNLGLGLFGYNPEDVPAVTPGERITRGFVRGVAGMAVPGGIVRGLYESVAAEMPWLIQMLRFGSTPTGLVAGGVGGGVGAVAAEAVPDRFKPLASMLGNVVGGGFVAGTVSLAKGAGQITQVVADRLAQPLGIGSKETPVNPTTGQPFTATQSVDATTGQPVAGAAPISATSGQMTMAGQKIGAASGQSPADLAAAVPPPNPDLPGQATIGQTTGNTGLLALERQLRTTNPNAVNAQEALNNAARVAALNALGTTDDVHAAASDFLHRRLQDIQNITPAEVAAQTAARQQAAAALPGVSPAETGGRMAEAIQQARAPAIAASDAALARQQTGAEAATSALGGGPETRLQTAGATQQGALTTLDQAKRDQVNRIFGSMDPDGTMNADMGPVVTSAKAINAQLAARPNIRAPDGETADILSLAAGHEPVTPLRNLQDLRTRITNQLMIERGPGGNPNHVAWLSQLLTGIDQSMGVAAGDQAVRDAAAVRAGTMQPGQTIGARMAAGAPPGDSTGASVPTAPSVAFTPSGKSVGVQYRVVEGDSLITSHNDDLVENPAYPQELQPRDRTRAASQAQVQRIATRLQPERLGVSTDAMSGAPIVGPDNLIESGNARTIAIKRALAANGPMAQGYRDYLTRQGFDVTGMRQPVLVRQRTTELSPAERTQFVREANSEQGLAMSAPERAKIDASKLTPDVLSSLKGGDVTLAQNAPFVRAVSQNMLMPGEEGSFATGSGQLSVQGAQRLRNALLQRAYGDSALVSAMAETADEDLKVFGGALQTAAGPMARLAGEIEAGRVAPDMAIGPRLVEAARIVNEARRRGIPLAEQMAQVDAFAPPVNPMTETLLKIGVRQ